MSHHQSQRAQVPPFRKKRGSFVDPKHRPQRYLWACQHASRCYFAPSLGVEQSRPEYSCRFTHHASSKVKKRKVRPTKAAAATAAVLQVVDEVAHASRLGFEVRVVVLGGGHLNRDSCLHLNPPGPHPVDLERVVGHQPDALESMDAGQAANKRRSTTRLRTLEKT